MNSYNGAIQSLRVVIRRPINFVVYVSADQIYDEVNTTAINLTLFNLNYQHNKCEFNKIFNDRVYI